MEVNQINQLMLSMRRRGIKKLLIKKDNFEIQLELEDKVPLRGIDVMSDSLDENPMRYDFERHRTSSPVQEALPKAERAKSDEMSTKEDTLSIFATSPMVGTIYFAPSPNDPPFVKVGDRVEKNTVVCIVEAMKVMNEVKAQVQGIVTEILVDNASPVEFGTKLFRISPT